MPFIPKQPAYVLESVEWQAMLATRRNDLTHEIQAERCIHGATWIFKGSSAKPDYHDCDDLSDDGKALWCRLCGALGTWTEEHADNGHQLDLPQGGRLDIGVLLPTLTDPNSNSAYYCAGYRWQLPIASKAATDAEVEKWWTRRLALKRAARGY